MMLHFISLARISTYFMNIDETRNSVLVLRNKDEHESSSREKESYHHHNTVHLEPPPIGQGRAHVRGKESADIHQQQPGNQHGRPVRPDKITLYL